VARKATPDHLRQLNALLEQALALPLEQRPAWLAARPAVELDFVPELARLLDRAAVETDTFMRHPVAAALDVLAEADARPDETGDLIGPYRLLQPLGEGGMATVWAAERADGVLTRAVALKLPRLGFSAGLAQRMARERDLLAALEHPHIARLYDAGVDGSGRPWLAMERVAGVPIDAYVQHHRLEPAAVLHLVLQVCDALAHAHARLIVHRDLKPANVLVTGDAQVRLLDFGVGKLLQGEREGAAVGPQLTQVIGSAMTPDYASPEQVAGKPVTVATDVYSLGVVLYELLSGQRPYRLGRQSTAALEEAILAADVPPASSRCADRARARALRGDLDAVLAKALEKHPSRRYASVESLAADLRAHLAGLPVAAQPPSRRYRVSKFLQRHRAGLAMAALLVLAGAAGLAGTLSQAWRAAQQAQIAAAERDRALDELRFADAADELMRFAFSEGARQPFTTQQLLGRAERQVALAHADRPLLRARLQLLMAELHREVAAMADAERVARLARESAAQGGDAAVVLQADCALGATLAFRGQRDEAVAIMQRVQGALAGSIDPRVRIGCHANRAIMELLQGNPSLALQEAEAGLQLVARPQPGFEERSELELRVWRGEAQGRLGDGAATVAAYEHVLQRLKTLGLTNTSQADAMLNNAGNWHSRTGHPLKALAAFEQVLSREADRSRPRDPVTLLNYARALSRVGRHAEAQAWLLKAIPLMQELGNRTAAVYGRIALASAACGLGPLPRCERRLDEAEREMRSAIPAGRAATAVPPLVRAQARFAAGHFVAARAPLAQALAILEGSAERDPTLVRALALAAQLEVRLGRPEVAEQQANRAVRAAREFSRGFDVADIIGIALAAQGDVQASLGRAENARASHTEALRQLEATVGADAPLARSLRADLRRR
jgi:eukaryotic-like serine/threonine-protein kinase